MIPKLNTVLINSLTIDVEPSKTYRMDINKEVVQGYNDFIDGVKQAVFKILNTERYNHYIYSKNYGVELNDLLGQPITYVCPEIERRITEALTQDDRIDSVDSFSFEVSGRGKVHASFVVRTIFGDFESEKVVSI